MGDNKILVWVIVIALILGVANMTQQGNQLIGDFIGGFFPQTTTPQEGAVKQPTTIADIGCSQNPAYSYSGVDKFGTTTFTGTQYIKQNSLKPVSTLANPTYGDKLELWIDNSSSGGYCEVTTEPSVACGSRAIQTICYSNSTLTTKIYDDDNKAFLNINAGSDTGGTNVTIGANGVANLRLTYQGTSKKANMPFGGCLVMEVPTTITDVTANGAGISSNTPCKYSYTYTIHSTSNTYKMFDVPKGFDADGLGDLKEIPIQLKAGTTNPSGYGWVTWKPATYYVSNDGNFELGVEKDKNQDTTVTIGIARQFNYTII